MKHRKEAFSVALNEEHRNYTREEAMRKRITEGEVVRRLIEEAAESRLTEHEHALTGSDSASETGD